MDYVRKGDFLLYFHGSNEGRKVDCLRSSRQACAVITGPTEIIPYKFSRKYKSVIVEGVIDIVNEPEAKRQIMMLVVQRKSAD